MKTLEQLEEENAELKQHLKLVIDYAQSVKY